MDQTSAFLSNQHQFEKNIRDFIRIEVATSTTFATIALDSDDPGRKREDTQKARKGYDTALHFIAEAKKRFPDNPLSSETLEKLHQLKNMLIKLGEHSP